MNRWAVSLSASGHAALLLALIMAFRPPSPPLKEPEWVMVLFEPVPEQSQIPAVKQAPTAPGRPRASQPTTTSTSAPLSTAESGDVAAAPAAGSRVAANLVPSPPARPVQERDHPPLPYPAAARRLHQQGEVLISVEVDSTGLPGTASVIRSSGYPLLDDAAVAAVQTWRFIPAEHDGRAVAARVNVPVLFRLTGA